MQIQFIIWNRERCDIDMFILLAGGLLVIIIAVIVAVVSAVSAAVAAEADNGEE